jgi:hypothetical protein
MSIISKTLFSFLLILIAHLSYGQNQENDFIEYLYKSKKYQQLKVYEKHLEQVDTIQYDSDLLLFFIGKSFYDQQKFDSSINYLKRVKNGDHYLESKFLIGLNSVFVDDLKTAKEVLDSSDFRTDEMTNLKYFELSGISLLERDFKSYNEFNNQIFKNYYFFQKERESLQQIENDLKSYNEKSPFLAGLYSAILPGAGKFYAGKKGQGIYSFVISSLLALQAYESYQKAGPKSGRFIIYGSLFSLFHIGNVWSSALSVKKYNDEFYEAVDYRIKLDLRIPISRFFD